MLNPEKITLASFKIQVAQLGEQGKISHFLESCLLHDFDSEMRGKIIRKLNELEQMAESGKDVDSLQVQREVEEAIGMGEYGTAKMILRALFLDGSYEHLRKLEGYSLECKIADNEVRRRGQELEHIFQDYIDL